jgi:hypothetical protein
LFATKGLEKRLRAFVNKHSLTRRAGFVVVCLLVNVVFQKSRHTAAAAAGNAIAKLCAFVEGRRRVKRGGLGRDAARGGITRAASAHLSIHHTPDHFQNWP